MTLEDIEQMVAEYIDRRIAEAVAAERERLSKLAGEPVAYMSPKHVEHVNYVPAQYVQLRKLSSGLWTLGLHTADQLAAAIVRAEDAVERQYGEAQAYLMKQVKEYGQRITEIESANAAFSKRQEWWNDKMAELEQQLEQERRVVDDLESQLAAAQADAERNPLTQAAVVEAFCALPHDIQYVSVFEKGVRFAEQAHGIAARRSGEGV